MSAPVNPRPASAVVLARSVSTPSGASGLEVFMVRRHGRSAFVPGAFVFPGGSVSADDTAAESAPGICDGAPDGPTALGCGFRVAAIRECFEEAGVLLATRQGAPVAFAGDELSRLADLRAALNRHETTAADVARALDATLATATLLHWAHWITPEPMPKRFDTHFFLAAMPALQQAAHDQIETTAGIWIRPEDALARFEGGDFPLVFATIHQLRALTGLTSLADAHARFAGTTPRTIHPRIVQHDDRTVIVLPEAEEE
jgi:8-oxo-dGTP pyrophosphatase MutT (NUDIX family)